jgi:flagellar biosynthesis protein FlhG
MPEAKNSFDTPSTPVICLSSGKGGVGKTSIAVNLGLSMVQEGHRVLLVDGDLGLANVDVMLGLTVRATIRDVLASDQDPMNAVIFPEPDFGVLPASSGVPDMVNLGPEEQGQLGEILKTISGGFDFVLVDTAAGIGPSVLWFNSFSHRSIIILTPDPTALTDAYALIKVLSRDYGMQTFYLLVNMVRDDREGRSICDGLTKVVDKFLGLTPEYLGAIPRDPDVSKSVRDQVPFLKGRPRCKASNAIRRLAEKMISFEAKA